MNEADRRLIVIGMDGGTFEVIDRLTARGRLPVIAGLTGRGARCVLESTVPPVTIPAWPSFYTGMNPAKFGAFDFFVRRDGLIERIVTRNDVRANSLWGILGRSGLRSIVMNVPGTFPPEAIDGILVSGMLTPSGAGCAHPPSIRSFLDEASGGYVINESRSLARDPTSERFLPALEEVARKQARAFRALLDREPWRFGMIVFRGTDIVQHLLWNEPGRVDAFYETVDGIVGEILSGFDDAHVVVMSDHGFGSYHHTFDINRWLVREGYLRVKTVVVDEEEEIGRLKGERPGEPSGEKRGMASGALLSGLAPAGDALKRILPPELRRLLVRLVPQARSFPDVTHRVDHARSRAHALTPHVADANAVYILERGAAGRRLREEIAGKLRSLTDPHTGKKVFDGVFAREDIYHGEYLPQAPDLVLLPDDDVFLPAQITRRGGIFERLADPGSRHRRDGVLIAAGPDGAPPGLPERASILDLAPSILRFFGLEVDEEMDGKVIPIAGWMRSEGEGVPRRRYPLVVDVPGGEAREEPDEEIVDRLRGLGYLE